MTDQPNPTSADDLLFAYGTLGPLPAEDDPRWTPDAIRGRLYDLGPYPVLVDWDDPLVGWVEGHVRALADGELESNLDPYEGVDEGLFVRIRATTRLGRLVWVYVYPHALPKCARGPLTCWQRLPVDRASESS